MNETEPSLQPDELDAFLRRSLQLRPEAATISNLADRAIRLAHSSDRAAMALARFKRLRRWVGALTAAAILLVAVILFFGGRRTAELAPLSFSNDTTQADSQVNSTSTGSSVAMTSTSQSSETQWTALLAAGICCGAILLLALRRAFEPDSRFIDSWQLPRAC